MKFLYVRCCDKLASSEEFSAYATSIYYAIEYIKQYKGIHFEIYEYECDSLKEFLENVYNTWHHLMYEYDDEIEKLESFDGKVAAYCTSNELMALTAEGQVWDEVVAELSKTVIIIHLLYTYFINIHIPDDVYKNVLKYVFLIRVLLYDDCLSTEISDIEYKYHVNTIYDVLDEAKLVKYQIMSIVEDP